jgi:hypothetical protein
MGVTGVALGASFRIGVKALGCAYSLNGVALAVVLLPAGLASRGDPVMRRDETSLVDRLRSTPEDPPWYRRPSHG